MSRTLQQAIDLHRTGNAADAEILYRALLRETPDEPDTLALLGVLLTSQGKYDEAIALIEQAIRHDPNAALFRLHLGNALMAAGRIEPAAAAFRAALHLQPAMAEAHYNLGNALRMAESWDEAAAAYRQALTHRPDYAEARNNLALIHEKMGRLDQAVAELRLTTAAHPAYGEGWLNLCNFAEKISDYDLALKACEHATRLLPDTASAWLGFGVAYSHLNRDAEALSAYQAALRVDPAWINAWDNLGQTYQFMGRIAEAESAYRKMIELAGQTIPDEIVSEVAEQEYGNRHWHLALVELLQGKYREGFARYRSRFQEVDGLQRPHYPYPLWQGEDLRGKTILIGDEQGHGDCLMFCRYLPLLKAGGASVALLVHPALAPLFAGWPGADKIIPRGTPLHLETFDYHASIFDLPFRMKTRAGSIPAAIPYLPLPPPDGKTRLEDGGGRPRIGVVWAGNPTHKHDRRRSVPLAIFSRLFAESGLQFFSVNRDMRPGDKEILAHYPVVDLAPKIKTFTDAAQFVGQMDLVITCDTSMAHLAGGMGKKVWTLLPFAPDWRWLTGLDDSPWYPTMRLFRQDQAGDWAGVIARVRAALRKF